MDQSEVKKFTTNGTVRRIPKDEPVFLLRGQDKFAAAVVRYWADQVEAGGGDPEIVATARAHADKMDAWPAKKVPDLPKAENLFVTVPETTLPNGMVVPSFQVAKYLSTVIDGIATVSADEIPTVEISYHDANAACEAAGFKLIRETQALALAWDIYHQPENWTGGAVGEGSLFQGLRNGNVDEAQPNGYEPQDPNERRWFKLSNGEIVFDVAGHLFTWVFDDVQGNENGIVAKRFAEDSPSITTAPHPAMEKGVGWYPGTSDWSGRALIRGGSWLSDVYAGVFRLGRGWPDSEYDNVGFRCTKP